jgi:hypothetical protein
MKEGGVGAGRRCRVMRGCAYPIVRGTLSNYTASRSYALYSILYPRYSILYNSYSVYQTIAFQAFSTLQAYYSDIRWLIAEPVALHC